jgi:hypothetical protein
MTLGDVSDVFVFKGKVQVTDESGEGGGLCEAGEGVRARGGRGVVKTAADWDAAGKMFAAVSGNRALDNPAAALSVADRSEPVGSAVFAARDAGAGAGTARKVENRWHGHPVRAA